MAQLVPNVEIDSISVKPERDTAMALVSQLGWEVTVFHSYPWLRSERNDHDGKDTLKEGETDFIVIIPDLGFLVLEVKGGEIVYDPKDRKWYRMLPSGDRRQIKDPFQQARTNTHVLKQSILNSVFPGQKYLPCSFGYAVVFPDCNYAGSPPPGGDEAIILSERDLPHLGRKIPEILKKWGRGGHAASITAKNVTKMIAALKPTFNLIPVLSRQIADEHDALVKLTEEQSRLLDFLERHDRCMVEGVAGSGKTLLAMEQARRFASRGMMTLFVCYNKALAEWLKGTLTEQERRLIVVYSFHALCSELCGKAGINFYPSRDMTEFFKNDAPHLLMKAIEVLKPQYDAIVVDEGQDFEPQWWVPLELLGRDADKSPFFLFYDPAQNLFVKRSGFPELGVPFPLKLNCRNTRKIAKDCGMVRGIEIATHVLAPEGTPVIWRECPSREMLKTSCTEILNALHKDRIRPQQIAILSPFRNDTMYSSLFGLTEIGGFSLVTTTDEWRDGRGVLFATIRSFKGLEADVVIMADVCRQDIHGVFTKNDFYVGMSRARHILAVLSRDRIPVLLEPEK